MELLKEVREKPSLWLCLEPSYILWHTNS